MKYKYKEAIHREKMCAMISLGERAGVRADPSRFTLYVSRITSR